MCQCNPVVNANTIYDLGAPNKIWAIPAIHAQHNKLIDLHDQILQRFKAGDRIIYLGNYAGYGTSPIETLNEILTFRRIIMSINGALPSDIVYLRGMQEEILDKLWQLHYAPQPEDVFLWMLGNGLAPTLKAYGIDHHDAIDNVRLGSNYISRWINKTRDIMRAQLNSDAFSVQLSRAATRSQDDGAALLFVNAGLQSDKKLSSQGDSFWCATHDFDNASDKYYNYEWVIRGYDPKHRGVFIGSNYATLDNGCGFGGSLIATAFDQFGDICEYLEAN